MGQASRLSFVTPWDKRPACRPKQRATSRTLAPLSGVSVCPVTAVLRSGSTVRSALRRSTSTANRRVCASSAPNASFRCSSRERQSRAATCSRISSLIRKQRPARRRRRNRLTCRFLRRRLRVRRQTRDQPPGNPPRPCVPGLLTGPGFHGHPHRACHRRLRPVTQDRCLSCPRRQSPDTRVRMNRQNTASRIPNLKFQIPNPEIRRRLLLASHCRTILNSTLRCWTRLLPTLAPACRNRPFRRRNPMPRRKSHPASVLNLPLPSRAARASHGIQQTRLPLHPKKMPFDKRLRARSRILSCRPVPAHRLRSCRPRPAVSIHSIWELALPGAPSRRIREHPKNHPRGKSRLRKDFRRNVRAPGPHQPMSRHCRR